MVRVSAKAATVALAKIIHDMAVMAMGGWEAVLMVTVALEMIWATMAMIHMVPWAWEGAMVA